MTQARTAFLIVDDDDTIRRLLKRMMSGLDVTILEAESVQTAKNVFLEHQHVLSAVWTDIRLLDGSGVDLGSWIRSQMPRIPIVYLSGARISDSGHFPDFDAQSHVLQKPFSKSMILDLCREISFGPLTEG